jgi:hypothetical protein
MGDQAGQLGESGEYWMGRLRVVWCQIQSSKVVAPTCVDWGTIVWPRWTRLSCVLMQMGFMGSHKLSSLTVLELDDTLPHFTDDIGIVFGPPTDYPSRFSHGRRYSGEVGPGLNLWQSMWKVATRGTCVVHVCRVVKLFSLARWLLIRISLTPSDMGEACSLLSLCRSAISWGSYEIMVMLIMTTW